VKEARAAQMLDSGAWKAGLREGIMEGVRTRTDGFGAGVGEGEVSSGRKDWSVRMGVRRRVLRRSEKVVGERVAIGEVG
jgi:hypothetical protein